MSTYTTNYNMVKPEYTDVADIVDINGNMDILDEVVKDLSDKTDENTSDISGLQTTVQGKQDATDNTLATTNKTIPGAINELKASVDLKQNITDNSLATTAKTVPGAINELNALITKSITAATRNSFQNALVAWGDSMTDSGVAIAFTYPTFSDSVFDGSAQPAIMVRRQSGVYRVAFPCICVDGYYYSSAWHWRKGTMNAV